MSMRLVISTEAGHRIRIRVVFVSGIFRCFRCLFLSLAFVFHIPRFGFSIFGHQLGSFCEVFLSYSREMNHRIDQTNLNVKVPRDAIQSGNVLCCLAPGYQQILERERLSGTRRHLALQTALGHVLEKLVHSSSLNPACPPPPLPKTSAPTDHPESRTLALHSRKRLVRVGNGAGLALT